MAGIFPFETRMLKKPRLGYREVRLQQHCILGRKGDIRRGHEFHYSEIVGLRNERPIDMVYDVRDGQGREKGQEGFLHKNTLASYVHVHFGGNGDLPGFLSDLAKGERFA
jgi:cobyrinic acid a,c-diamide synthase